MSRFPTPPPTPAGHPEPDIPPPPPPGTFLAKGMTWRGELVAAEDVRVAGFMEGDIESTGVVTVERTGLVKGSVTGARVVVHGEVEGDVRAARLVRMEKTGRVLGNLEARSVSMVEGAVVGGGIRTLEGGGVALDEESA